MTPAAASRRLLKTYSRTVVYPREHGSEQDSTVCKDAQSTRRHGSLWVLLPTIFLNLFIFILLVRDLPLLIASQLSATICRRPERMARTLLAILAVLSARALSLPDLLRRDDANCPSSYKSCGSSFPSDFCCPSSTYCFGSDHFRTFVCCPNGSTCGTIEPITCNIQAQNATAAPKSNVKTTRLDDELPRCGDKCCPFGYSCQDGNKCSMDEPPSKTVSTSSASDEDETSTSSSPPTTTFKTATSSTSSTDETTSMSSISIVTESLPSATSELTNTPPNITSLTQKCPEFPAKAITAGFFPGLVSGALAAAIVALCIRHRHRQQRDEFTEKKKHRRKSSAGTMIAISDPIPIDDQTSFRTDFLLRRGSGRYPQSMQPKSMLRRTGTRVKSLFSSNKSNHGDNASEVPPVPPIAITSPQQQHRTTYRPPSMESIRVYSPGGQFLNPGNQEDRPSTTFSEMMERAGFQRQYGEAYNRSTPSPVSRQGSPMRR